MAALFFSYSRNDNPDDSNQDLHFDIIRRPK